VDFTCNFHVPHLLGDDDVDLMNSAETKDWFYWVVNGIAELPELDIKEDDLHKCIKGAKVGLITEPEDGVDYTKCWAYASCKIDPDW
jgi:hypothetical protein